MRILVAHNVPGARTGGMSRIMGFIHDEIVRAGHDVDYLTSEDLPARYSGFAARFAFPLLVAARARAAARAGRPYDLLNVHEPSAAAAGCLRRIGRLPPVVVTSHGLERRAWRVALEEARLDRGGPAVHTRFVHPSTVLFQASVALALADFVFVLNEEDRQFLMRETGRSPATVLRIFPGAAAVYAQAAEARDYGRCGKILFAGTWRTNKGIDDLVPAMRLVWARRPDVTLTLFGTGVPTEMVRAAFGDQASRLEFVSARTDEEAARIYAASDLLVLPSLFEGTPLVLVEAMASGLPIVTTDVCGMKDVITHRRSGWLVPVRDPARIAAGLLTLAEDEVLRAALGRTARQQAETAYTWPAVARPVLEAYKSLV